MCVIFKEIVVSVAVLRDFGERFAIWFAKPILCIIYGNLII